MARTSIYNCNEELKKLFEKYNKDYFQGKLKDVQVKWSNRLTSCAGICYSITKKETYINLSSPILTLRPRKDLANILLHEMIHAYLFVVDGSKEREEHGPKFHNMMEKINRSGKHKITVYHEFHDEVDSLQSHWWKCTGKCTSVPPKFGIVKRSMDRPPGPSEVWWLDHKKVCKGTFVKVKGPKNENVNPKKRKLSSTCDSPKAKKKLKSTTAGDNCKINTTTTVPKSKERKLSTCA